MIVAKAADSDRDAERIFSLLVQMHAEVGIVPLDPGKALWRVYQVAAEGAAFFVEEEGEVIASLGLEAADYWYGKGSFLAEIWFYVRPDKRDGNAAALMLQEARALSESTGMRVMIDHYRPGRAGRGGFGKIAERYGFVPEGSILSLEGP